MARRLMRAGGAVALLLAIAIGSRAAAQQLEPRAYAPSPKGANFVGLLYVYSTGDLIFDPTLPFTDVHADISGTAAFYARTFGFFGRAASVAATIPYTWGTVDGNVAEVYRRADRSGLADVTVRFASNLFGAPARDPREFAAAKPSPTLGASLIVKAPVGEYDPSKLINIGTNRWSFKPELGFSYPVRRWWLEAYGGAWLTTTNHDFFGGQVKSQDPIGVGQAHVVYTLKPRCWVALDGTYYFGGATTVSGVHNADRQENSRVGATLALPVHGRHSLKLEYAKGATARVGSRLETFAVAWQYFWLDRQHPAAKP
jgi:hypothetical protein